MDNIYRVVIMAGETMLFLVALSTGIYLYSVLMRTEESILNTSSNSFSRKAEKSSTVDNNYIRRVYPSEVVWTVLSMVGNRNFSGYGIDYVPDVVTVYTKSPTTSTYTYYKTNKNAIKAADLKKNFGNDSTSYYTVSYTFSTDAAGKTKITAKYVQNII